MLSSLPCYHFLLVNVERIDISLISIPQHDPCKNFHSAILTQYEYLPSLLQPTFSLFITTETGVLYLNENRAHHTAESHGDWGRVSFILHVLHCHLVVVIGPVKGLLCVCVRPSTGDGVTPFNLSETEKMRAERGDYKKKCTIGYNKEEKMSLPILCHKIPACAASFPVIDVIILQPHCQMHVCMLLLCRVTNLTWVIPE